MPDTTIVIVLDSGFSREVVEKVRHLVGFWDLNSGLRLAPDLNRTGGPEGELSPEQKAQVLIATTDPLNHGSVVLARLLAASAELPVILLRVFADDGASIKSRFDDSGALSGPGWTEAYLWAQHLCSERGFASVANCSFGGFHHAMDGSGWESYQLSRVIGPGKPGHIVVAATGPGDGSALHASCQTRENSRTSTVSAWQPGPTTYNIWVDRKQEGSGTRDFALVARLDGVEVFRQSGLDLRANFWNGRQQSRVRVDGHGLVQFEFVSVEPDQTRFDLFISETSDAGGKTSYFCDNVDCELVSEPAVFAQVIAVGLKTGSYGSRHKPDVLLEGFGPISFRTPEVTYALSCALTANPPLDSQSALSFLLR